MVSEQGHPPPPSTFVPCTCVARKTTATVEYRQTKVVIGGDYNDASGGEWCRPRGGYGGASPVAEGGPETH